MFKATALQKLSEIIEDYNAINSIPIREFVVLFGEESNELLEELIVHSYIELHSIIAVAFDSCVVTEFSVTEPGLTTLLRTFPEGINDNNMKYIRAIVGV